MKKELPADFDLRPPLARKLILAMRETGITGKVIADACGVTQQAVSGWQRTGSIAKEHLETLVTLTGKPLAWWLEGVGKRKKATPAKFDAETIEFAEKFHRLDAAGRRTFRALMLVAMRGVVDEDVEKKMRIAASRAKP